MIVNELRIGNYILHNGKEYCIDGYDIYKLDESNCDDIAPIPLTEEWLLKFGFDKDGYIDGYIGIIAGSAYMELMKPKIMGEWQDEYCWGFDKFKFVPLKYVHQLQNLYFALTQTELTIKNK